MPVCAAGLLLVDYHTAHRGLPTCTRWRAGCTTTCEEKGGSSGTGACLCLTTAWLLHHQVQRAMLLTMPTVVDHAHCCCQPLFLQARNSRQQCSAHAARQPCCPTPTAQTLTATHSSSPAMPAGYVGAAPSFWSCRGTLAVPLHHECQQCEPWKRVHVLCMLHTCTSVQMRYAGCCCSECMAAPRLLRPAKQEGGHFGKWTEVRMRSRHLLVSCTQACTTHDCRVHVTPC